MYDHFSSGILGYLEKLQYLNDMENYLTKINRMFPELPFGEISFDYSSFLSRRPEFSKFLYPFALMLEDNSSLENKIISLNDDQRIKSFQHLINQKWIKNNRLIYTASEEFTKLIHNDLQKNLDTKKLAKKIYSGSKFITKKLIDSLNFIYNPETKFGCYKFGVPNENVFNYFVYLKWFNKNERQVLVGLIRNHVYKRDCEKLNFQYGLKTGLLYKDIEPCPGLYDEDGPYEIYAFENLSKEKNIPFLRKSYFTNESFTLNEISNLEDGMEMIGIIAVDLNREDYLQKTWKGRWYSYWKDEYKLEQFLQRKYFSS